MLKRKFFACTKISAYHGVINHSMDTYTFSEFHLDEAELLLDLEGARTDLLTARDYVEHLLDVSIRKPSDYHLAVEAFCVAAITKYGRAFIGGVRKIDKELLLSDLPQDIEATHQTFMNWRNLHVAHSVNDFEMAKIQARYCAERVNEEGITSISVAQSLVIAPGSAQLESLLKAIDFFLGKLKPMIEAEEKRVLAQVRSLPLNRVIAMDEPPMLPGSNPKKATSSRKRK